MSSLIIDPVKPAVDSHTAFVSNPFTRKDAVMMMPNNPQMGMVADQVNKLINHVLHRMDHEGLSGYELIHEWIKSGFINKNGIWKVSWDDTPMETIKELRDISPEEVDAYVYALEQQGFDVEMVEEKVVEEELEIVQQTCLLYTSPSPRD